MDGDGCPRILDFGLARITDTELGADTGRTAAGRIQGTLPYMSPEQARGQSEEIDVRSDIYSLGVLVYELLADRRPYEVAGLPLPEAVRIIGEQRPARLGGTRSDSALQGRDSGDAGRGRSGSAAGPIDRDLETIVFKALEKEPQRRYAGAAALAEDIQRYLSNEPILARPSGTIYHFRKFVERHRVPVALAAGLFLSVTALAVTSTIQAARLSQRQAQVLEAQQRATRRFNQVHELAGSFLFEFHDRIVNLPGSTSARQMLVSTALKYLDGLAAEAGDDSTLLFDLAQAYQRVGQVQHSIRAAHLGDSEGARRSQQRALEILEDLHGRFPGDPRYSEFIALGHQYIGELSLDDRNRESDFGRCFAILDSLIRKYPDRTSYKRRLYQACLGKAYGLSGNSLYDPKTTREELERARKLIEDVLAAEPGDVEARRSLGSYHDAMGDFLGSPFVRHEFSDDARALEHYEQALALQRQLAGERPDDRGLRRGVIAHLGKTAVALSRLGRMDEALRRLNQTVEGARAISQADPNDARARKDLMGMLQTLADLHAKAGHDADAIAAYHEAVETAQALLDREPGNYRHALSLGTLWQQTSALHEKRKDWSAAVHAAGKAMEYWESDGVIGLLHDVPYGKVVEGAVRRLAGAHLAMGDAERAIAEYERGVALFERVLGLKRNVPDSVARCRLNLVAACGRLGDALMSDEINRGAGPDVRQSRRERACLAYQQGLEVVGESAAPDGGDAAAGVAAELRRKAADCGQP